MFVYPLEQTGELDSNVEELQVKRAIAYSIKIGPPRQSAGYCCHGQQDQPNGVVQEVSHKSRATLNPGLKTASAR